MVDGREAWEVAKKWIDLRRHSLPAADQAACRFSNLGWNAGLKSLPGDSTQIFARMISDRMISDGLVDMMIYLLGKRISKELGPQIASTVVVVERPFIIEILQATTADDYKKPKKGYLQIIEGKLKKDNISELWFPALWAEQIHWLPFKCDFRELTLSYGDPLKMNGKPQQIIQKTLWWLRGRVDKRFKSTGNVLRCGRQNDTINCGIIAVNTIAHHVIGDALWVASHKVQNRIKWFNDLCEEQEISTATCQPRRLTPRQEKKKAESVADTTNSLVVEQPCTQLPQSLAHILNLPQSAVPPEPAPATHKRAPALGQLLNPISSSTPVATTIPQSLSRLLNPTSSPTPIASEIENQQTMDGAAGQAEGDFGMDDESAGWMGVDAEDSEPNMMDVEIPEVSEPDTFRGDQFPGGDCKHFNIFEQAKSVKRKLETENEQVPKPSKKARLPEPKPSKAVILFPVGESKTAVWEQKANVQFENGSMENSDTRMARFTASIQKIDEFAEIKDAKHVRCSRCAKPQAMKTPFNVSNFKNHSDRCKGPTKYGKVAGAGGMATLDTLFNSQSAHAAGSSKPNACAPTVVLDPASCIASTSKVPRPCLGLTPDDEPRISQYLERSGAMGGGARSLTEITGELFPRASSYKNLSAARKQQVDTKQVHEWVWRNDHAQTRVFSTKCKKVLHSASTKSACTQCLGVISNGKFKKAISRPCPPDGNFKYNNQAYRGQSIAELYAKCVGLKEIFEAKDTQTPALRYAIGVLSGKYKGDDIFGGLLNGMIIRAEKEEQGVGTQGMRYSPQVQEFWHILHMHSPRAFRFISKYLPAPTERTIRRQRSALPNLPLGIQDRTFTLVQERLKALKYNGPVALSCDDTKLMPAFRPYYDHNEEAWFILGGTGEPRRLLDPAQFESIVKSAQIQKATKIRVWCLQVPIPKIAPMVVAAMPISDSNSAEALLPPLWKIVNGLLDGGTVQLKDARNAVFSGAKEMVIGNQVVLYIDFREMSFADDGPIYRRDVSEKMDRQDDAAATRLLSAASLEWFKKNKPDKLGVMVYLFVFGELIDAYQSRTISIEERVQIALRTYFFMEIWENFLQAAGYPKHKYFISYEFRDVVRILIHGLMQLVYIYRDHTPGDPKPILFWLMMTEPVEHVFGVTRDIVKDFSMLNFQEIYGKLHIQLREVALNAEIIMGKACASGYSHTYTDNRDINIPALSTFPSDIEIDNAAVRAYEEAENLFAMVGVVASEVCTDSPPAPNWFCVPAVDEDGDFEPQEPAEDDQCNLQEAIENLDRISMPTQKQDNANMDLTYGVIALTLDDQIRVSSLPEPTSDQLTAFTEQDSSQISKTLHAASSSNVPNKIHRSTIECDIQDLVDLRLRHQTKQAATGVRKRAGAPVPQDISERREFMRRITEIIKSQEDHGTCSGVERGIRWRHAAPGGRDAVINGELAPAPAAGTSANAAAAAKENANIILRKRRDKFKAHNMPSELETGRITSLTPLSTPDGSGGSGHGFVLHNGQIMVAKVLSVYSKTGGKNGRHAWVSDCSSIAAASNIPTQVYEHMTSGRQFRAIPQALQGLRVPQFALIPSSAFLCLLTNSPEPVNMIGIKLSAADGALYKKLNDRLADVVEAVKALGSKKKGVGRGKGKEKVVVRNLDSDEEDLEFPESVGTS
ncbi:hypothetical protein B0H11DRAFT_2356551 [Mycena galericulata]|nr:hypothetical protein B0H11DRAFT_2356551 [Mycena galericulata]